MPSYTRLIVLLGLCIPYSASAEIFNVNDVERCDGTTLEMAYCVGDELEKADKLLNAVHASYVRVVKKQIEEYSQVDMPDAYKVTDKHLETLNQSRKMFEAYREQMSELSYNSYQGGTGGKIAAPMTSLQVTIEYIWRLLAICNPEGDPKQHEFNFSKTDWCGEDLP